MTDNQRLEWINLTRETIVLARPLQPLQVIPPSGSVAIVVGIYAEASEVDGMPCARPSPGSTQGLPDGPYRDVTKRESRTYFGGLTRAYLVTPDVARAACGRRDVFTPDRYRSIDGLLDTWQVETLWVAG